MYPQILRVLQIIKMNLFFVQTISFLVNLEKFKKCVQHFRENVETRTQVNINNVLNVLNENVYENLNTYLKFIQQ